MEIEPSKTWHLCDSGPLVVIDPHLLLLYSHSSCSSCKKCAFASTLYCGPDEQIAALSQPIVSSLRGIVITSSRLLSLLGPLSYVLKL